MMTLVFLSQAGATPDRIAGFSCHPKGAGA
jgi:hypothetical protein